MYVQSCSVVSCGTCCVLCVQVYPQMPYAVDDEVQLVCKYLNAYKITQAGNPNDKGIDRLFKEGTVYTTICIS